MQLQQLEYFVTICRLGTMSEAARTLQLAQPSLSQQIRKLETELETQVFERSGRRLVLTEMGEILLPWAEQALEAVRQGRAEVQKARARSSRVVRVGAIPSIEKFVLPQALQEFRRFHRDIEVSVLEADPLLDGSQYTSAHFDELLLRGELDLAIKRVFAHDDRLSAKLLIRDRIVLLIPPDHPLAASKSVSLGKFAREPFISLKGGSGGLRDYLFGLCREAGFEPRVSFETGHLDVVQSMVLAGRGLAILPKTVAGDVNCLPIESQQAMREISVLWREGPAFTDAARAFLVFLEQFTEPLRSFDGSSARSRKHNKLNLQQFGPADLLHVEPHGLLGRNRLRG